MQPGNEWWKINTGNVEQSVSVISCAVLPNSQLVTQFGDFRRLTMMKKSSTVILEQNF